jgi:hypothetical protein
MTTLIDPITLAGMLAEAGITRLELVAPPAPPRELLARDTDLPGLLRSAPLGAVLRTPLGDAALTVRGLEFTPALHAAPGFDGPR